MKNFDEKFNYVISVYKKYWYYYLLAIMFIIILAIVISNKVDKQWEEKLKEYPPVKREQSINKTLISFFTEYGASYIITSDSTKFRIQNSVNYHYKNSSLGNFIQEEDSLVKRRNSDTLFIYRNDKKYYFVLGKFINQEK
jgi:hypothetical protein